MSTTPEPTPYGVPSEFGVQGRDLRPVGARGVECRGMTGSDRRLHLIGPAAPDGQRLIENGDSLGDQ